MKINTKHLKNRKKINKKNISKKKGGAAALTVKERFTFFRCVHEYLENKQCLLCSNKLFYEHHKWCVCKDKFVKKVTCLKCEAIKEQINIFSENVFKDWDTIYIKRLR